MKAIYKIAYEYNNLSAPVKASFWFLICGFLQKAFAVVTTPVFTRIMTPSEYGLYSVYYSWYNIISIIGTLYLAGGVYMRGLVKYNNDQEQFTSSMEGLATTSILIISAIYCMFYTFWNNIIGLSTLLMSTMFIDMLFTSAFQFWSNQQKNDYKYRDLIFITLSSAIGTAIVGIIAVMNTTYKVEARVLSSVIINSMFFLYLYIRIFKRGKKYFDKNYWIYGLKFNLPLIPHYLSQIALNQADRLMINFYCGSAEAGIYSLAYSIALIMIIFNSSVANTFTPWIYKKIKLNDYGQIEKISYAVLIIIALLNFMVIAIAPEIVTGFAPNSYKDAIWVIPPISISVYFMFLYSLFAVFEYYYGKTFFIMWASVIGAILSICLNIIFIPKYGFISAGYTSLACYILYSIAHYYFMRKVNKIYMDGIKIYDLKKILSIGFSLIIGSAIMVFFYKLLYIRLIILFLIILIAILYKQKLCFLIKTIKS